MLRKNTVKMGTLIRARITAPAALSGISKRQADRYRGAPESDGPDN
jgi:hypothetical protein